MLFPVRMDEMVMKLRGQRNTGDFRRGMDTEPARSTTMAEVIERALESQPDRHYAASAGYRGCDACGRSVSLGAAVVGRGRRRADGR